MNLTQAKNRLKRLWGAKALYRINERALVGDKLAAARESLAGLLDARKAAEAACVARRKELLADPEYQRLVAELTSARTALDEARGQACARRITIGHGGGMFFHVAGEGDTWEEAFEKAESKQQGAQP